MFVWAGTGMAGMDGKAFFALAVMSIGLPMMAFSVALLWASWSAFMDYNDVGLSGDLFGWAVVIGPSGVLFFVTGLAVLVVELIMRRR